MALYNDPRRCFVDWIRDGDRVLDVGCACGDFGCCLASERRVEILGLEYDQGSVEVARATGAFTRVIRCDLEDTATIPAWEGAGTFDVIVFGDVLEHLRDPAAVLAVLLRLSRPGGLVLISLPNLAHANVKIDLLENRFDYTDRGIMDRTHLRFFTWRSIAELLDSVGLRILEARTTVSPTRRVTGSSRFRRLHPAVGKLIVEDQHSFVNQYVVKCKLRSDHERGPSNAEMLRGIRLDGLASRRVHAWVRVTAAMIPRRDWRRRYRERMHLWLHRHGEERSPLLRQSRCSGADRDVEAS